jgi:hypothetical protein
MLVRRSVNCTAMFLASAGTRLPPGLFSVSPAVGWAGQVGGGEIGVRVHRGIAMRACGSTLCNALAYGCCCGLTRVFEPERGRLWHESKMVHQQRTERGK